MTRLTLDISMSLDGFVAGPNATLEDPLGEGGELLHEWILPLQSWRREHGKPGGETGVDDEVVEERVAATGAVIMGRRMFSGGEGPWEDDPNADGWWGDEPPFREPVFVLTRHPREPEVKKGGTTFTFVTDGIESALERGAGGRRRSRRLARRRRERRPAVPRSRPPRRARGPSGPSAARRRRPAVRPPRRAGAARPDTGVVIAGGRAPPVRRRARRLTCVRRRVLGEPGLRHALGHAGEPGLDDHVLQLLTVEAGERPGCGSARRDSP